MRPPMIAALLALAAVVTDLDLLSPDGRRAGRILQGPGGQVDIFDAESRRIGWGRCDRHGGCELFNTRGEKIGTATRGKVILLERLSERTRARP